jgi:AAA+ ATPase superfamily predicted ATPase
MNKELIRTIFNLGYHFGIDTERSQVFIKERRNHKTPHLLNLIDWEAERVLKFLEDLNIEERELSLDERAKLHPDPQMFYNIYGAFVIDGSIENSNFPDKDVLHKQMDKNNIPTKLITVTYKDKTIEIYE